MIVTASTLPITKCPLIYPLGVKRGGGQWELLRGWKSSTKSRFGDYFNHLLKTNHPNIHKRRRPSISPLITLIVKVRAINLNYIKKLFDLSSLAKSKTTKDRGKNVVSSRTKNANCHSKFVKKRSRRYIAHLFITSLARTKRTLSKLLHSKLFMFFSLFLPVVRKFRKVYSSVFRSLILSTSLSLTLGWFSVGTRNFSFPSFPPQI